MSRTFERRIDQLERGLGGPRGSLRIPRRHTRWIRRQAVEFYYVDLSPEAARPYEKLSREYGQLLAELGLARLNDAGDDQTVPPYGSIIRFLRRLNEYDRSNPVQVAKVDRLWRQFVRAADVSWAMDTIIRAEIAAAEGCNRVRIDEILRLSSVACAALRGNPPSNVQPAD